MLNQNENFMLNQRTCDVISPSFEPTITKEKLSFLSGFFLLLFGIKIFHSLFHLRTLAPADPVISFESISQSASPIDQEISLSKELAGEVAPVLI